ncbi:MAG: magnetosome biogenesis CDF transporter MamM [Magnetococcales bacterium]|nr:magnetosome biogenesis CDF transporter MamM [Magnetococcales bacterium]NGZ26846.1 magnetosome biogenesis CDF transporter MamM [Magnetococcales bacterium]
MRYFKCMACNEMIGWIGLVVNFAMSGLKLFVGGISGSHALVVDGLYSAKDVVTSGLIVIGLKLSKQPIDKEHPFGHGKVEFLISLVISLLLVLVVMLLFYLATDKLITGNHQAPHLIALWTAVLSVVINLFMQSYAHCVAVEINSPIVETLSKHHHSDGVSSMAVAVGIIGSHYLAMPWLDSVVAIGETLDLLILGGKIFWEAFHGLMDSSAPDEINRQIESEAMTVAGVKEIRSLRTRRVGQEIWIDLVIGIDPDANILAGKFIARRVEEALATAIHHVGDISVHFRSVAGSVPEFDVIRPLMMETLGVKTEVENQTALPPPDSLLMLEDHSLKPIVAEKAKDLPS